MIQTNLPAPLSKPGGAKVNPDSGGLRSDYSWHPGAKKFEGINSVALVRDNNPVSKCLNFFFPCLTSFQWRVATLREDGHYSENTLYTFKTVTCCPLEWRVYQPKSKESHLDAKRKACCSYICCCSGPTYTVFTHKDSARDAEIGDVHKPCQCCNFGLDIREPGPDPKKDRKYYIGSNWGCKTCLLMCFCGGCYQCIKCKKEKCCGICTQSETLVPIWDAGKSTELGMTKYVHPCPQKIPCCYFCFNEYFIIDFPKEATNEDKALITTATVMLGYQFPRVFHGKKPIIEETKKPSQA